MCKVGRAMGSAQPPSLLRVLGDRAGLYAEAAASAARAFFNPNDLRHLWAFISFARRRPREIRRRRAQDPRGERGRGVRNGKITAWAALAIFAAAPTAANAQTTTPPNAQTPPEPRSCQQLHEQANKCAAGMRSCDQRVVSRLEAQCQRDEKRLPQVLGPRDGGRP